MSPVAIGRRGQLPLPHRRRRQHREKEIDWLAGRDFTGALICTGLSYGSYFGPSEKTLGLGHLRPVATAQSQVSFPFVVACAVVP